MIALVDEQFMPAESQSSEGCFHVPVLLVETVTALEPAPGKLFLDGTVGGGGHSLALLEAGASVIACDQDPEALDEASTRLPQARRLARDLGRRLPSRCLARGR